MKAKKAEKANLENKRGLYFQLGLIISFCITLSAFEWSSTGKTEKKIKGNLLEEPIYVVEFVEPQQKQQSQQSSSKQKSAKTPAKIKQVDEQQKKSKVDTSFLIDDIKIGDGDEDKPKIDNITISATQKPFEGFEVDTSPQFPGGQPALREFVNDELRIPQITIDKGVSVKMYLSFVVDSKGNVKDVEFLGGKASRQLKKEAIRVLNNMPSWEPGMKDGKPVSVKQQIPIHVVVK